MDSPTPRRQNIPNLGCEIEAQGNLSMEATAHPIRVQTNCTASHRIEYCDVDRIYFIPGSRPQLEVLPPPSVRRTVSKNRMNAWSLYVHGLN